MHSSFMCTSLLPPPNTNTNTPTKDKRLVHAGFRRAFRSIREAVYTALYFVTHNDLSQWKIDVCGHSLGPCTGGDICRHIQTFTPRDIGTDSRSSPPTTESLTATPKQNHNHRRRRPRDAHGA